MAAGATYEPIATTTLGSTASEVNFTSISGSYTDLVIVVNGSTTTGKEFAVQFNGDTGSNYSRTILSGTGSAANSNRQTSQTVLSLNFYGNMSAAQPNTTIVSIQNYSNSTTYKSVLARANDATSGLDAIVGLWRSTSAITSIKCLPYSAGTFASGLMITLYGIAAA